MSLASALYEVSSSRFRSARTNRPDASSRQGPPRRKGHVPFRRPGDLVRDVERHCQRWQARLIGSQSLHDVLNRVFLVELVSLQAPGVRETGRSLCAPRGFKTGRSRTLRRERTALAQTSNGGTSLCSGRRPLECHCSCYAAGRRRTGTRVCLREDRSGPREFLG